MGCVCSPIPTWRKSGALRWIGPVAAVGMMLGLAGCSPPNSTRLPELSTIPRRVLSAEEQQKAMDDMKDVRETHRDEAIKEIERKSGH